MPERFTDIDPEVGDKISTYVVQSASLLRLDSVTWYHGDPIWFVQQQEEMAEQSVLRRVQITTLKGKLYFVPQLFAMPKTEQVIKTFERIDTKQIQDMRLQNLEKFDDFQKRVEAAWSIAQTYDPGKLDKVIPRVGNPL
jgi:hypothetical protein